MSVNRGQARTNGDARDLASDPVRRRGTAPRAVAFWLVALAFAVTMLGTTLPTPLYPRYQQEMGFSTLMITVIFATYAVGVLAALLLFGNLSDEIGRRRTLLPALGCAVLSAVVFLPAQGLALILIGRVLSGLSAGIFTGTATAALVDLAGAKGGQRATLVATAVNMLGLGSGPLLSGVLAQFAPAPLRLPFAVHLGLLVVAVIGVWTMPEPVAIIRRPRLRFSRPRVPVEVRPTFVRAAIAGFAGFAVLGLFNAVSPSFLGRVLGLHSPALSGAVVFALFAASTAGQAVLVPRIGRASLAAGCAALVAGMALLVASLTAASLPLLLVAVVVAGVGQGMTLRAGLTAVNALAPGRLRGAVASSFFLLLYVAISLPVVGEGLAADVIGLRTAGIAFSTAVGALALVALVILLRADLARRRRAPAAEPP